MAYHSENYDKYISANGLKKRMIKRFNQKIIGVVNETIGNMGSNYLILDAGCGEGFLSCLISKHFPNVKVIGIDASAGAIQMAKAMNKEACFHQGNVYQIPFDDGMFDLVICTEVLEHLEMPCQAVQELLRVAKHTLLLSVPDEPWFCLGNLVALKNVKRMGNPIDHRNHWTYNGFVKFVRKTCGEGYLKACRSFPWSIVLYKKNLSVKPN